MFQTLKHRFKGDPVVWMIVFLLAIVSTLAVYSAISTLAVKAGPGKQELVLVKHLFTVGMGIAIMLLVHNIKFTYFSKISQLAFYLAIPLLALTLLFGTNLNDASRWLVVPGLGISFQTSDLGKIALIAYLARILAKKQDTISELKEGLVPILTPILIICGLILPANFSTSAVLFMVCFILMFIGGVHLKYLFSMMGIGLIGFSLLVVIALKTPDLLPRLSTWKARIENFASGESEENYQVNQAKIAVATGGLIGKGPGKSTQRNFLPHPYSDFMFAFIVEEYGMIGGAFIIALYTLLLYRAIVIANKCENIYGSILVIGLGLLLIIQAFINMAVSVNLIPVTGQPLPLVSKGGTSVIFTGIAIGMILSVSRNVYGDESPFAHLAFAEETNEKKGGDNEEI